jgi:ribonuclease VapC
VIFADASVLVAVQTAEAGWETIALDMRRDEWVTSPVALLEAGLAVGCKSEVSKAEGCFRVQRLLDHYNAKVLPLEPQDATAAAVAYDLYGRGSDSRAKLNMGDCFAYAMAKRLGARLLYKGDDFAHTDLA